jgi:hypothetical protein
VVVRKRRLDGASMAKRKPMKVSDNE